MNFRSILFSLCLLPCCLFGSIVGNYEVSGYDPILDETYTGTAVITELNGVYTIVWTYPGNVTYIGTGVLKDDFISFVYTQQSTTDFGTQLYEIHGKKLKGPWVLFQDTRIGCERLKKVCNVPG